MPLSNRGSAREKLATDHLGIGNRRLIVNEVFEVWGGAECAGVWGQDVIPERAVGQLQQRELLELGEIDGLTDGGTGLHVELCQGWL
jgi:hypothetical protein